MQYAVDIVRYESATRAAGFVRSIENACNSRAQSGWTLANAVPDNNVNGTQLMYLFFAK